MPFTCTDSDGPNHARFSHARHAYSRIHMDNLLSMHIHGFSRCYGCVEVAVDRAILHLVAPCAVDLHRMALRPKLAALSRIRLGLSGFCKPAGSAGARSSPCVSLLYILHNHKVGKGLENRRLTKSVRNRPRAPKSVSDNPLSVHKCLTHS